jgi:toxin ParE1/3/4
MGRQRETTNPNLADLRQWPVPGFEKYLIFYRPAEDGIDVVRVLHGARDLDAILDEEEQEESNTL